MPKVNRQSYRESKERNVQKYTFKKFKSLCMICSTRDSLCFFGGDNYAAKSGNDLSKGQ